MDKVVAYQGKSSWGLGQGGSSLTAVLVGFSHLGELFKFLGTVLLVALSFPLLTGLKPLLDDTDNLLINLTGRKRLSKEGAGIK